MIRIVPRSTLALPFVAAVIAAGAIAGCSPGRPPAPGTLENPQRIVSLAPSLTEAVFAVGAGNRLVGATIFCDYPPEVAELPKVGGVIPKTINLEQILALRPDLVLSSAPGQEPVVEELRKMGVDARIVRVTGIDDTLAAIQSVADWVGLADNGRSFVSGLRSRMESIRGQALAHSQGARPRVFYEVWDEPLMTAGPQAYLGQLVEWAGGKNIFDDIDKDYPEISHEEVVRRDPQIILAARYGDPYSLTDKVRVRPGWHDLSAVRNNRAHLLDGTIISRPGPRIDQALALVTRAIHPDLELQLEQ